MLRTLVALEPKGVESKGRPPMLGAEERPPMWGADGLAWPNKSGRDEPMLLKSWLRGLNGKGPLSWEPVGNGADEATSPSKLSKESKSSPSLPKKPWAWPLGLGSWNMEGWEEAPSHPTTGTGARSALTLRSFGVLFP